MVFRFNRLSGWEWTGAAILAAALIAGSVPLWDFTVDDSFIPFRYAKNLIHGKGLAWNPGETEHTEGSTSFSLVLLDAAIVGLGGQGAPHVAAKVIGLLLGFGLCLGFIFTARRHFPERPFLAPWLILVFFLLPNAFFNVHCVSGMETILFSFLVFALFAQALSATPHPRWFALTGLAAGLTRPEGALVFPLALLFVSWPLPAEARKTHLKWAFLLFLLPGAAFLAWKMGYYGDLLPNTFYVKNRATAATAVTVQSFFRLNLAPLALAFGSLPFQKTVRRPFALAMLLALPFAGYLFTDHVNGYGFRYFFPILLPLLFLGVPVVRALVADVRKKPISLATIGAFLLFAGVAAQGLSIRVNSRAYLDTVSKMTAAYAEVGKALRPFAERGYTLALSQAGAISYFSEWKILDYGKLNSRLFTRGTGEEILRYLERDPPDAILLSYRNRAEEAIGPFAGVMERRRFRPVFQLYWNNFNDQLFVAEGLPEIPLIVASLKRRFGSNEGN